MLKREKISTHESSATGAEVEGGCRKDTARPLYGVLPERQGAGLLIHGRGNPRRFDPSTFRHVAKYNQGVSTMKTIKIDLPADLEEIELFPLFDWHIGDNMSDAFLIEETLRHIKETPNAYCILGGDLMDTAIASSRSVLTRTGMSATHRDRQGGRRWLLKESVV